MNNQFKSKIVHKIYHNKVFKDKDLLIKKIVMLRN